MFLIPTNYSKVFFLSIYMTPIQQLQKMLDGRKYRDETTKEIEQFAKDNNLVIVFGCSDDLVEFRGAINDEMGASDERVIYFDKNGLLDNECDEGDDCPYFKQLLDFRLNNLHDLYQLTVHQPKDERFWSYTTDLAHLEFSIMEDNEPYCTGIIIDLNNINN